MALQSVAPLSSGGLGYDPIRADIAMRIGRLHPPQIRQAVGHMAEVLDKARLLRPSGASADG